MEKFEEKFEELGKFLAENGPSALRFTAGVLVLFPQKTVAFRLGVLLKDLIKHLPE